MIKHILLAILILTCFQLGTVTAQRTVDLTSCSILLEELGYYWRKDSLANNGLRLYTYDKFLKCNLNNITKDELIRNLGRPSSVKEEHWGTRYIYYTWDTRKLPKELNLPRSCTYISFGFLNGSNNITIVSEGDIDI